MAASSRPATFIIQCAFPITGQGGNGTCGDIKPPADKAPGSAPAAQFDTTGPTGPELEALNQSTHPTAFLQITSYFSTIPSSFSGTQICTDFLFTSTICLKDNLSPSRPCTGCHQAVAASWVSWSPAEAALLQANAPVEACFKGPAETLFSVITSGFTP